MYTHQITVKTIMRVNVFHFHGLPSDLVLDKEKRSFGVVKSRPET